MTGRLHNTTGSYSYKIKRLFTFFFYFVTEHTLEDISISSLAPEANVGVFDSLPYNQRGRDLLKKSTAPTVGTGLVISSTNGSGGTAGIEGLILSPSLVVWEKNQWLTSRRH